VQKVTRTIDLRWRSPKIRILIVGAAVTYSLIVALTTSGLAAMRSNSMESSPIEIAAQGSSKLPSPIPFQTVARGSRSGIRESLQTVARSQIEWEALWQKHVSSQSNPPSLPAVDFSNEIVVAVFLGEKPTGGYGIEIISADPSDGPLTVSFNEKGPRSGDMQIQAFTQPFHIVRIANHRIEEVRFRRVS
jgi:hypothetical protein